MAESLTRADVERGLAELGLAGRPIVVHASLRSLGQVDGGAWAVASALTRVCGTVMMPAFCFDSNAPPPPGDRPRQNGCDYAFYERWSTPAVPFRIEAAAVDRRMGAIARSFAALPGASRSDHAWHSWAAIGPNASRLLDPHPWSTANLPLERLAATDAAVVLVGVGLTACTAVHVAEERAGRRPFIRWAADRDGVVRRVRAAGCSKGFDALEPFARELFVESRIGGSRVRVAPLEALIERCAEVVRERPAITVCADTCLRCRDGARGGPIEDSLSEAAS